MERSWRAWMRAGVITAVIAVHSMIAAPSPRGVDREDLRTLEGKEEIDRWRELLSSVGVEVTRRELSDEVVYWTHAVNDAHRSLRKPFVPWLRATGTGQGWALFASPDTWPHRLEVYIYVEDRWVPIYRRNDPAPDLDFLDDVFRYRRVRGIYDGSTEKQRVVYWNFSRWIAKKALIAHPDATKVRIQMVRTHTTLPWEAPDPSEKARAQRVFTRAALLPEDGLAP